MKKLLSTLEKLVINTLVLLNIKVRIESEAVKRSMLSYFHYIDWSYKTTITDVVVYQIKNGFHIEIKTHRPGLLIGKRGIIIDGLKQWIKDDLLINNVEIHLNEDLLWYNLYM